MRISDFSIGKERARVVVRLPARLRLALFLSSTESFFRIRRQLKDAVHDLGLKTRLKVHMVRNV